MFELLDDDEEVEALYENGHWEWNEETNELVFESDLSLPEEEYTSMAPAAVFGNVEFKDDIDVMDQQRFWKRFQRKMDGDADVVLLQDIKDIALYTAPSSLLTPSVISIIHAPLTDRFIRSLILYCQYYLQTAEEMSRRVLELESKIRTKRSIEMEMELKDDLEDLRLLVAKEYVTMILGGGDNKRFHHMGSNKKTRSLAKKDIAIFESILRMSIQMVWIALGRKSFNQIEVEINRIFKSQIFNMVEHKLKTNFIAKMSPIERQVLLGHCLCQGRKLNTRSPLVNELFCPRPIDYKLFGLATVKFPKLSRRLRYLEHSLSMSERLFQDNGIILGILGLSRSRFDIMLREIKMVTSTSTSSASIRARRSVSRTSRSSMRKSIKSVKNLYEDIELPRKDEEVEELPSEFPTASLPSRYCSPLQRLKWMARAARLAGKYCSVLRQVYNRKPNSTHTTLINVISRLSSPLIERS